MENFTLDANGVMVIEASPCPFCLATDASDGDSDWTVWEPSEHDQDLLEEASSKFLGIIMVKAGTRPLHEVEVVLDFGADVSAKCGPAS